jgi:hypothetical protein
MTGISNLWVSEDPGAWSGALERYWSFVQPRNLELERSLDALDLERIRSLDAQGWFDFLRDEYFRWKYTSRNSYATTTRRVRGCVSVDELVGLDRMRQQLLVLDTNYIRLGLRTVSAAPGLGTAGALGLLALLYPKKFGTVDQFAIKALRQVEGLPEAEALARMEPAGLSISNGVVVFDVLRRKAAELNVAFIRVLDAQEAGHGFVGGMQVTTRPPLPARG